MRKLWKIIALVTLGSALAATVLFVSSRARETRIIPQDSSTSTNANKGLTFRLTMIFDGRTDEGERYANSFYKASDCESLSKVVIFFNSVERAKHELKSEEKKASTLVERSALTNSEGRQTGERIVLRFDETEKQRSYAKMAWTSDKEFHSISAPSLERLLEFDSALKTRNGRLSPGIDSVQEVTFTASEIKQGSSEGFHYTQQEFRSSDCETVTVRTEFFTSPERAQEQLLERLKAATTIVQRGPRPNTTTLQTARVVAMVTAPPSSEQLEDTIVLWTDNAELHSIRGTMVHALEFERRNFR